MSAITDALAGVAGPTGDTPARRCKVGQILDALDTTDRAALSDALAGADWSNARLARAVTDAGTPISATLIGYHRNRLCRCTRHDESETR